MRSIVQKSVHTYALTEAQIKVWLDLYKSSWL